MRIIITGDFRFTLITLFALGTLLLVSGNHVKSNNRHTDRITTDPATHTTEQDQKEPVFHSSMIPEPKTPASTVVSRRGEKPLSYPGSCFLHFEF